jgi:hypothetical protein
VGLQKIFSAQGAMHLTTKECGPCVAECGDKQIYVDERSEDLDTDVMYTTEPIQPIPYMLKGQRTAVYVVGASGSGKSTFIANMLATMPKKKKRYLFSVQEAKDPAFPASIKKVNYMKHKALFSTLEAEDLKNSICIFDDHDLSTDKSVNATAAALLNSLLENGRKLNIDLFVVSHNPRDFLRTRTMILECDTYVLFPQTNRTAVARFLKEYFDDDKDFLATVKSIDDAGRFSFVCLHKNVPRLMTTAKSIRLLP